MRTRRGHPLAASDLQARVALQNAAGIALLSALLWASAPRAEAEPPPPAEGGGIYSPYEEETIANELKALRATRDPHPEGQIIERIDVIPLDVIETRDPVPTWLNAFHATTRRSVIRREMLLRAGDRYQQVLVDETIRNLRRLPQLSVILVATAKGRTPNHVVVVIITKDVWSLRASWNVVATPGGIEQFLLAPTETNLLGTHQTIRGTFILEPSASTFGLAYTIPRLDESRVAMVAAANVMVNRATGSTEGSYGSVVTGEPIVSGLSEWAWDATTSWQDVVLRRYVNAQPSVYLDPTRGNSIPYQYRAREFTALYELTRSFGWENKHDFTFAAAIDRNVYPLSFPGADPRTVADFAAAYVPVADTRVGPSIQYHAYTKRYLRVIDLETLGLQEDFHLGHDIVLGVTPSFRALGATRDIISLQAAAEYTVAVRDGLMRVAVSSVTEPELDLPGAPVADAFVSPAAHFVTPTIGRWGRLVVDGTLLYRWRNHLNQITYLGGDDRLRGFPTSFFAGKDWFAYNMEFRSRPVEILTCQLAGVAFYDVGHAFSSLSNLQPFQSLGVGFRALFPQLDRLVFRADIGFPIRRPIDPSTGEPIAPYGFLVSFGQAFDVPSVSPPSNGTQAIQVDGKGPAAPVLPTGQ